MAGAAAIIALIDQAPVFAPADPGAFAEAVRLFGLSELDAEIKALRTAEGLARKDLLAAAAERLAELVAAGALHEAFARAAIMDAAGSAGLIGSIGLKGVKAAIAGAWKLGRKHPRDLSHLGFQLAQPLNQSRPRIAAGNVSELSSQPDSFQPDSSQPDIIPGAAAAAPPPDEGQRIETSQTGECDPDAFAGGQGGAPGGPVDPGEIDLRLAFFPLTDLGNAERFRERWRGRLIYSTALGWLVWDGKRWSARGAEAFVMLAEHTTVRAIQDEARAVRASGCKDADDAPRGARDFVLDARKGTLYSDRIAQWGRASESANKLGALSKRGAPYFAVDIDALDTDKMKINVGNGTLTIARRADRDYVLFGPHDPADLITKIAPVDYVPAAEAPEFAAFLARVQPKPEMRAFLSQWLGYSLTGDVSAQKLAFLYGKGGNGKSVLVDAVSHIAGDYGETVPIETFLDQGKIRNAGQATPDLAILPGVRLLRTSEPEKNSKLAEALIKLVTGGEPIQARHLNRDFFKFYPQFKLTISGNYKPTLSGTDEGIRRRVMLVPFDVTIPKEERDPHLAEKLRAEASGILNWMLDGLRVWLDHGLTEPEAVTSATAEYFSASDPLGRFLATCVVSEAGARVQSSVLHQVYEAWCKSSGENAWKNRGLSLAMDERGYKRKQSDVVWWLDIRLIRSVNDFVDHEGNPIRVREDEGNAVADAGSLEL